VLPALGSTVAWDALRAGTLDAYVDYSGTLWATVLHGAASATGAPTAAADGSAPPMPDRATMLATLTRELRARWGVEVVGPLGFENTYALAMDGRRAATLGVTRISQLAALAPTMEVGGDYELFGRPEWQALRRVYGLRFARERAMDPSLMYEAIATHQVDLIGAYSTDGRIAALGLRLLEDDRHVIPPYDAVLLARPRLAIERPAVLAALRELVGTLDASRMQQANLAVDQRHGAPRAVARTLLPPR
jgi:osmoprotectant transport system permease protein